MWLWYQVMSLSMISPVRGSDVCGPDGVAHEARRPAHHRVRARLPDPSRGPRAFVGGVLREDRVLEARLLEDLLPVLDALPSRTRRHRVGVAGSR